jgi:hypothetical protein
VNSSSDILPSKVVENTAAAFGTGSQISASGEGCQKSQ